MNLKLFAATAAFALATPAFAANLVTNGSFETGSFAGWSQFGDTSFTAVVSGPFDCCSPTDGAFQAVFGPVDGFGGITQAVGAAGSKYVVSFDIGNDSGGGNYVNFGGVNILNNVPGGGYVHYSFTVTAADNSGLTFGFFNNPAYYNLDNVSVAAVPEPATWALMIGGFAMTGFAMRRRKVALAA